jgi:cytochrome c oxidase subunit 2
MLTTTQAVDPVFMLIFGICLVLLVGITGAMVWFVIRYHRSRAPQPTSQVDGNLWLELIWTVLPTLLVLAMFYYGWSGYLSLRTVPTGALPVTATARMWSWSFTYENGKTSPKLYVPVGKPVVVNLVSRDVLHGFYLPAFRVKRDVVPGMKNHVWFMATKAGSYDLFCSQYCGVGHSSMIATVEALPEAQFVAWLQGGTSGGAEPAGRGVLEKHGCLACHSLDGSPKIGPSLKGLFGTSVTVVRGGATLTVVADEAFLRESIRKPTATVVTGFPPVMPADATLTEDEVTAILEYLKGLK